MKNREWGITLVSLAVTIIVMLILAAVAINLSVGDKGLIGQTKNAISGYENITTQEQESLNSFVVDFNEALNGGNESENEYITERPEITIAGWNTTGGLVEISTNASYTTEYKIGNGNWQTYQNANVGVENGSIIYARYKDNEGNTSQAVSRIVKDTNPPILTGNITGSTPTTVTVNIESSDKEMGMPNPKLYKYYIKTQNESNYTYITENNTGSYTYINLNNLTIYEFMITADDIAGNTGSIKLNTQTGEEEPPEATMIIGNITTKKMEAEIRNIRDSEGVELPYEVTLNYYIKKTSDEVYPNEPEYSGTNKKYTFEGLDQNTQYDVKVTFKNELGVEGYVESKEIKTLQVPNLTTTNTTFTLSEEKVTNKPITVEIEENTNTSPLTIKYTLQYSTDGNTYQNYTGPITIDKNTTIYARLWDDRDDLGNYGGAVSKDITNVDTSLSDLEVLIKRDEYVDENTEVTDEKGNKIVIPEGFKPTEDATTIDKGVVVEDKSGNQFVWIPVGNLNLSTGGSVSIDYDRYAYSNWKTNGIDGDTNSTKIQTTEDATEYFIESLNASEKNSAVTNGGYYIGRFEAGTTKERTSDTGTGDVLQIKQNSKIYNWVTGTEAKNLAEGMYTSSNYTSNLTSSYAWDTAIKFLEKTGNTEYLTNSTQGNYYNTKHGGKTQENANVLLEAGETESVNNIYDLGGNVYEWTTEEYSNNEAYKVARGGFFGFLSGDEPVIGRLSTSNTGDSAIGFRVALFIGQVEKVEEKVYIEGVEIPKGFYYVGGTKEDGIVISDKKEDENKYKEQTEAGNSQIPGDGLTGNQFVWVPVENPDEFVRYPSYSDGNKQDLSNYYEPAQENNRYPNELEEYNQMKKSVEENKGFYVARYEAGNENGNLKIKKGIETWSAEWGDDSNYIGDDGAAAMSQKIYADKNSYGVTSTLIYGVQWDAIMAWIDPNYKTSSCADDSFVKKSTINGNYTGDLEYTGSNDKYRINNIYDLAGNMAEWTMETYARFRVYRGGWTSSDGNTTPASYRYIMQPMANYPDSSEIGFRIALYL